MVLYQTIFFIPLFHLSYLKYHPTRKAHLSAGTFTKTIPVLMQPSTLPSERGKNASGSLSREPEIFSRSLFFFPLPPSHGSSAAIFIALVLLWPIRQLSTAAAKSTCYSQAGLVLPPLHPITPGEEDLLRLLERFVSPLPFCSTANGNPGWLLLITQVHWESRSSHC